ncbi:prepilin peptidase [Lachnoclostridium sp. Marseille-P6806]|uniref:prepilin peptidase n=1 Tax=Lachnoclostridium sp. Marseille-P6806 TaxID=2364793 RepID=UPI0013EF1998|nr:prepilin peptidase [Lachnoclostridium sp. Marseille-P6806]
MAVRFFAAGAFLLLCSVQDLRRRELSVRFLLAVGALSVVWDIVSCAEKSAEPAALMLACMPGLFLLLVWKVSGGRAGAGDGAALLVTGLLTGLETTFLTLCGGLVLCALGSGVLLAAGRVRKDTRIPFVPFLLAAFGGAAYVWYRN